MPLRFKKMGNRVSREGRGDEGVQGFGSTNPVKKVRAICSLGQNQPIDLRIWKKDSHSPIHRRARSRRGNPCGRRCGQRGAPRHPSPPSSASTRSRSCAEEKSIFSCVRTSLSRGHGRTCYRSETRDKGGRKCQGGSGVISEQPHWLTASELPHRRTGLSIDHLLLVGEVIDIDIAGIDLKNVRRRSPQCQPGLPFQSARCCSSPSSC